MTWTVRSEYIPAKCACQEVSFRVSYWVAGTWESTTPHKDGNATGIREMTGRRWSALERKPETP
jgi:hypothetical protein